MSIYNNFRIPNYSNWLLLIMILLFIVKNSWKIHGPWKDSGMYIVYKLKGLFRCFSHVNNGNKKIYYFDSVCLRFSERVSVCRSFTSSTQSFGPLHRGLPFHSSKSESVVNLRTIFSSSTFFSDYFLRSFILH